MAVIQVTQNTFELDESQTYSTILKNQLVASRSFPAAIPHMRIAMASTEAQHFTYVCLRQVVLPG